MTDKAIESQGTVISYNVGGSPSTFTELANIVGFDGPGGGSASVIDVSNLRSIMKEKLMGLPDEGQFTVDLNFHPDQASHAALYAARRNRTLVEFKIALTDTTTTNVVFFGYVLMFKISGAVDQAVKGAMTVEIDGAVSMV